MRSKWYKLSDEGQKEEMRQYTASGIRPESPKLRPRRESTCDSASSETGDALERSESPDSFQVQKTRNNEKWTGFPQFQRGRKHGKASLAGVQPAVTKVVSP